MSDFSWTQYGLDKRQNRRIEELESSLWSQMSTQRSQARKLQAQLAQVQGTMEQRLARLAKAFDAFVELSDLREELRAFQSSAEARHHTRRMLVGLVSAETTTRDGISDVDGYWLPPAATAVASASHDDTAAADTALATARQRDADRCDLFFCVGLLMAGRPEQAVDQLDALLDLHADKPVTHAQRVLWQAAADGEFGEDGRTLITRKLADVVVDLSPGARTTQVAAWRTLADGLAGSVAVPSALKRSGRTVPAGVLAPAQAATRLERLRSWCEERLAPPTDPSTAPSDTDAADPLFAMLQGLVDEGTPEEQPLLNRVAELRRVVEAEGGDPPPAPTRWHNPLDDPLALLHADASSGATPGQRAVAVRAVAPLLSTVADQLATEAGRPVPSDVDMRVGRHTIRYGPEGPDEVTVAKAQAANRSAAPPRDQRSVYVGWGLAGLGAVVLLAGAILTAVGLILVGLGTVGAGGWQMFVARADERRSEQYRKSEAARFDNEVAEIGTALADLRSQVARTSHTATATRAALDSLFN